MRYNFNDNSLVIGYIKELLHEFNLPLIPVYTNETKLYKGKVYIKDNEIVKCKNVTYNNIVSRNIISRELVNSNKILPHVNEKYKDIYEGEELLNYEFEKIGEYIYNKPYLNLTKNLIINSSYYDTYTHEYLGDYLRFIRDYHKVDLMSLYNCFSNKTPKTIKKSYKLSETKNFVIDTTNNGYNYYIVPVKFDKVYSIAIDSQMKYEVACILYGDRFDNNTPEDLIKNTYKLIPGSKFNKPFEYKINGIDDENLLSKEKILHLLIKIPKSINTSITILEGNFCQSGNVIDNKLVTEFIYDEKKIPNNFLSKLSLVNVNNNKSYPFSDRLIEFLIGNAISPLDKIYTNISRIQNLVYDEGIKGYEGIWDNSIRDKVYGKLIEEDRSLSGASKYTNNIIINNEYIKKYLINYRDRLFDLTGYVDKDTEGVIG